MNGQSLTSTKSNGLEKQLDVSEAPAIPGVVYENLPELLKTRSSLIDIQHKRDVFTLSALPVIAAHMPNVLAGHVDGYYSPDLFTLIVAKPGSGKNISNRAKKMGKALHQHKIERSQQAIRDYEALEENDKLEEPEPQKQSLFIAANTSSRSIYDRMAANNGSGLIFETEIDTMLTVLKQDWGSFSDVVRKAFHHESLSISRKDSEFWIEEPRLSICMTGTFDQFKAMFDNAENGHFSRYALYTFDAPRKWQSHRPTNRSRSLDESVETASTELFEIYRRLNNRPEPLFIDLSDDQWQNIDDTFAEKMQIIEDFGLSSHLHASNNRAAVLALRMASIFTVLRANDEDPNKLVLEEFLTPTDADMTAALWLADTFIKHAFRLYYILPKSEDSDPKGQRYQRFLSKLPGEFETVDALLVAESLDIPESTTKYWLSNMDEFKRIRRGYYEKV